MNKVMFLAVTWVLTGGLAAAALASDTGPKRWEELFYPFPIVGAPTPLEARYPVYLEVEADSSLYLAGTEALPPSSVGTPARTVFIAPEIFLGPFKTFISDGTRLALGVFFNVAGDREHNRTYSLTVAFDIPNSYGY